MDQLIADDGAWLAEPRRDAAVMVPPRMHVMPHRVLSAADIAALPPRRWLCRGYLARGELAVLFGRWGAAKTFIALDLARAVALGTEFLGRSCVEGSVLYAAGEGLAGICDRLRASIGVPRVADPTDLIQRRLFVLDRMPDLGSVAGEQALLDALAGIEEPTLLVVDTMARLAATSGADENSTRDMGALVAALDRVRAAFPGLAVLVVHHTGHGAADRGRGSSALPAAADVELRCERLPEPGSLPVVRLSATKTKDSRPPPTVVVHLGEAVVGEEDDGEPRTSLFVTGFSADRGESESGKTSTSELERIRIRLATGPATGPELRSVMDGKARSAQDDRLRRFVEDGVIVRRPGLLGYPDQYDLPVQEGACLPEP